MSLEDGPLTYRRPMLRQLSAERTFTAGVKLSRSMSFEDPMEYVRAVVAPHLFVDRVVSTTWSRTIFAGGLMLVPIILDGLQRCARTAIGGFIMGKTEISSTKN